MHLRGVVRAALCLASNASSTQGQKATGRGRSLLAAVSSGIKRNTRCVSTSHFSTSVPANAQSAPLRRVDTQFTCGRQAQEARAVDEKGWLEVVWQDGLVTQYPYVWLRDNCTCEKCFNPHSQSRISILQDLDLDMKPTNIKLDPTDASVEVTWPDDHSAVFSSEWLDGRSFTEEVREARNFWHPPPARLWGNQLQDKIPKFDFNKFLEDDQTLYDWITTLQVDGLALLTGAPPTMGQLRRIGDRVAYLKPTLYGDTFQVTSKFEPSNLAYTPATLPLHTDLNYYYFSAGMQMLHCVEQVPSEGGDNLFADGFNAAYILKEQHPEMFDILTTTGLDQIDIGSDVHEFFTLTRRPVIELDKEGNVCKISISGTRDSYIHLPVEEVIPLYRALKMWDDTLYKPENHISYKLKQGDVICVHNHRVMHGRLGYKILAEGNRHLEGGYLDWDEMNSKRRRLMMKLGINL